VSSGATSPSTGTASSSPSLQSLRDAWGRTRAPRQETSSARCSLPTRRPSASNGAGSAGARADGRLVRRVRLRGGSTRPRMFELKTIAFCKARYGDTDGRYPPGAVGRRADTLPGERLNELIKIDRDIFRTPAGQIGPMEARALTFCPPRRRPIHAARGWLLWGDVARSGGVCRRPRQHGRTRAARVLVCTLRQARARRPPVEDEAGARHVRTSGARQGHRTRATGERRRPRRGTLRRGASARTTTAAPRRGATAHTTSDRSRGRGMSEAAWDGRRRDAHGLR